MNTTGESTHKNNEYKTAGKTATVIYHHTSFNLRIGGKTIFAA